MVLIQFFENDKANRVNLRSYLREIPKLHHYNTLNSKANDTLYDTDIKLYKGRDYILEEMEGLKFSINKSFYQTNSDQAYEYIKSLEILLD
jgi:23S rRNA (uracil1939-C5)-methyltransferase